MSVTDMIETVPAAHMTGEIYFNFVSSVSPTNRPTLWLINRRYGWYRAVSDTRCHDAMYYWILDSNLQVTFIEDIDGWAPPDKSFVFLLPGWLTSGCIEIILTRKTCVVYQWLSHWRTLQHLAKSAVTATNSENTTFTEIAEIAEIGEIGERTGGVKIYNLDWIISIALHCPGWCISSKATGLAHRTSVTMSHIL